MNILVLVKRVPDTSEAEVHIDASGKDIEKGKLSFTTNEADNYAVEEAIQLKEKHGGEVTVLSLGGKESDEVIRMALAKGAQNALRLEDEAFSGGDAFSMAKALAAAAKGSEYDLILVGALADDDGFAATGVAMAAVMNIPYAAYVKSVEKIDDSKLKVGRELEGGLMEMLEIKMPCLLTIQTGINEPRYASFKGIKAASKIPIDIKSAGDIGLSSNDVGEAGSWAVLDKFTLPVVGEMAEILEGAPDETAKKLAQILKEKGLV